MATKLSTYDHCLKRCNPNFVVCSLVSLLSKSHVNVNTICNSYLISSLTFFFALFSFSVPDLDFLVDVSNFLAMI